VAQALANHFRNLDAIASASVEELQAVEAIGPKIAESVHAYFQDPQKHRIVEKLREAGVGLDQKARPPKEGPLKDQTFVLTGTLASMPRSRAEGIISELGGDATSSVTRKTTYVVVGADPGSKLQKARSYGIPVLDEEAFIGLLREHGKEP
jgi:DNA ligase (NAD+)